MSRPRGFNEEAALDAAMACFWRHGYTATSVRDLGAAMGLGAASLYNSFGGKRQLFTRVLDRYLDNNMRARVARLTTTMSPRAAIQTFFDEVVAASLADSSRRGCLLVNSALEIAPHDAELGETIADRLAEIEGFFRGRVSAAQAEGEAAPNKDPAEIAHLLLAAILGLRVLARARPEPALLRSIARQALAMLGPESSGHKLASKKEKNR
jgi:TetR/AcrR family transcriptional repressor of nem operon